MTENGFTAVFKTWGDTKIFSVQKSYIAHNKTIINPNELIYSKIKGFSEIYFNEKELKDIEKKKQITQQEIHEKAKKYQQNISGYLKNAEKFIEGGREY